MSKRIFTIITLMSFILYLYGCSSSEVVQLHDSNIEEIKNSEIFSVVTKDYDIYEFDNRGYKPKPEFRDSVLVGWAIVKQNIDSYNLREVILPVKNINTLSVKMTDESITPLTILVGLALFGVLAVIALKDFSVRLPADAFKYNPMGGK